MTTRNHLIGGTDAASLLGLGRISPAVLYLRLRGEMPNDFTGNEATDAGRLFEDYVAVPMAHKHLGIALERPDQITLALPDEPRIGASFDFDVRDSDHRADIKLTGSRAKWGEPGESVPFDIAAQMQFGMAVARKAGRIVPCIHVVAMFIPGFTMMDYPVHEDQEVGSALLDRARAILAAADSGTPPQAGDEADARALFLGKRGEVAVATPEIAAMVREIKQLKEGRDLADKALQAIRDAVLPFMGNATELVDPATGEVLATWRPNRVVDHELLKQAYPAQYQDAGKWVTSVGALEKTIGKSTVEKFKREPFTFEESVRVFKVKE